MVLGNCDLPDWKLCESTSWHKYSVFHIYRSKEGFLPELSPKKDLCMSDNMKNCISLRKQILSDLWPSFKQDN